MLVVHKELWKQKAAEIAKTLGENWEYIHRRSESEMDFGDLYDSHYLSFKKNGEELFGIGCINSDPDTLWIHSRNPTPLSIVFGPVDEIHIQEEEEPKVIIESFVGEWVSFVELKSDGSINLYQHFKKERYRPHLGHSV